MDSCWTCGNPFHSYENCSEEIASKKERVPKTYDYRSQYDAYEYDIYHGNYNIEMEDDTMYRGEYGAQYFHPPSYETPSFFNQPQRPTQEYYYQGQKQGDNQHLSFDEKYDKIMSMIESNKEENQRYEASFAAHDASFTALVTHVDRLLEQLNRDKTYEPQGITMLDFDDEDEDEGEGEEQNEEFTLHSTNTMEWSAFGSCKDKEDADDHNNSFGDIISPITRHNEESVPIKVGEEVMEANTTPYLPTLEEPILPAIDDIQLKEDEEFLAPSLYEDKCFNLLDEAEVTHIHLNLPQLPRVAINQVREDDSVFENKKEQEKVSLVKDEHHVVERCHKNSVSKLTHIIVKQVHRKARVGVRKQILSLCHGKWEFQEVLNSRNDSFCKQETSGKTCSHCIKPKKKEKKSMGFEA
uniref:CCHC-type domain-containing protein n=1 Tax=Tanacetum cinerariifolium TaxID=118510 RepID=A0A699KGZ0_TANCI|nr:hypothetical protein [Tanacetum cinerariifolium]